MILPIAVTLSLFTLTSALPFNPSSASQSTTLELDISSGSASLRYPSFQPPQTRQKGSPSRRTRRRRDLAVDLGGEGDTTGGIIVLETNSIVDDGSLAEDSSFRDDDNDSSEGGEEEGVFDPSSGGGKTVIKNPKVIPNPKNPAFSSSIAAARSTSTTTTTTSSTTKTSSVAPTSTSVTPFKGQGTYFFQGGVAGACGEVNPDSALIVALDYRLYGDMGKVSKYCGKSLTITNTANGKSVVATVADACPSCESQWSLDLSEAAFGAIGDYDTGILPISWVWN
ncbi:hypothetical protein JCM5350_004337 [Sporobolomyces pararoseus]